MDDGGNLPDGIAPDGFEHINPAWFAAAADEEARRNLERIKANPKHYRQHVLIDVDGEPRIADEVLDDWQRQDFEAIDDGFARVAGRFKGNCVARAYLERPRGHSKTTDIALMVTWVLLSSERKINGIAAGGSKEQAQLLRDQIDTLLRLNPWLSEHITVNKFEVINVHTGAVLKILASDDSKSYGKTPDFIIADELTHWKNEKFWGAIFSSLNKRRNCVMVVISNAGDDMGWGWHWSTREAIRAESLGPNPRWYFHKLDGPVASWLSKEGLAEQERILGAQPAIYKRVWLNQWQTGSGEGIKPEDVTAALTLTGPWLIDHPPPFDCLGALDIGIKHDHAAFVVLGLDEVSHPPRVKVYQCCRWNPKDYGGRVPLKQVEAAIFEAHKRFQLIGVAYDPHQAERTADELEEHGIPTYSTTFSPKNISKMATLLLGYFSNRQIDLYDEPTLVTDLHALNIVTRGMSHTIEAKRDDSGHCDLGTALAIGLLWADGTLKTQ